MSFLSQLSSSLLNSVNQSFGAANTSSNSLDISLPFGTGASNFGSSGNFANVIDKSAHRQYLETGTIKNIRPRNLEVIMQEPDITVLIKKKIFSSLAGNFRYDLMNEEEKLFIRASKRLFYNKCRMIASYERLSKIERIVTNSGPINDFILPAIFSSVDVINSLSPGLIDAKTQSILDTIRKIKNFSDPNTITTWLVDPQVPYLADTGEGTGIFELTLVHSLNWTSSTVLGGGSANFEIEDPYKLMTISNDDIERAIADAAGFFSQNNFFRLSQEQLEQSISDLKDQLKAKRATRNVPNIIFMINETSSLYKKVRAIIDEEGREIIFNFDGGLLGIESSVSLDASAMNGITGLQDTEITLFQQIISNIFQLLGLQQTTTNQILQFNQKTNYVRRKMRLFFNGKSIIQPLDVIHIFVGSKTLIDNKVSQGLSNNFSSNSILNNLNNAVGNLQFNIDNLTNSFGGNQSSYVEIEKNAIAGPEFPTWLWSLMRNDFTRQAAGMHVFAGIVDSAPHGYDNGKYVLRVSANDHSQYFKFGQININPSVDVFNSDIYDPLTPFKLDFDASSGFIRGEFPALLDENIRLLNSGAVKAKTGRFRGLAVNESAYKIQDAEQVSSKLFRNKLNDPDGFVYRWKEGIGSLTLFGEPHASGTFGTETSPSLTTDPFAGQDTMNVLSLLISGQPYNFNNFLRAALSSGNLSRDELLNENGSSSFFRGLISDLTKQNQTWGNFIPFKKLVINESGYNFLRNGEFDITNANRRISELLRDRAKRFDELTSLVPEFANNPQFYKTGVGGEAVIDTDNIKSIDLSSLSKLGEDIIKLDFQIKQTQEQFNKNLQQANVRQSDGTLKIFGDDISFDSSFTGSNAVSQGQRLQDQKEFRQRLHELTQRRLWKVKANEDQNLFIVDDSYDKNYDIQAFEKSLSGRLQLFKSTYTNVFERISGISQLLGLEVFADSQGHIQVRAPQYNRMPSSVFYKMLQEKNQKGIQIFPDYLENLFFNQIQGLTQQLEIIEDEIRIRAAALGAVDDIKAKKLLNGSSSGGATGNLNFSFVTTSDGSFGGKDLRVLLSQASPDFTEASTTRALDTLNTSILGAVNSTINFDIVQRSNVVNSSQQFNTSEQQIDNAINAIGQRLEAKKGFPAPTLQTLLSNDRSLTGAGRSQLDLLNVTEQISQFLSERQHLIKLLANAIKNLNQGISLNNDPNVTKNILFPNLSNTKVVPDIIEHMIEDEAHDDYGPGSGQRYILSDSKIISLTISERPPDWTVVEVDGQIESGLVSNPNNLEIGDGGNAIATAFAVDYDMWRMYGFRAPHAVPVPFLSDPDAQCAPYAVYLLNKARKDILQANVTVIGNEAIQPGEVYYLEDRDLLFYAESISGNFTYGGQFMTSLNLKYGHNPGEYIPTILDIIGKGLYTNRHQANLIRHERYGNASGDTHLATLVNDNNVGNFGGAAIGSLVSGSYGDQNRKNLTNLLLATTGLLSPSALGQDLNLQIRIYFNSKQGHNVNSDLQTIANSIKEWVVNPAKSSFNLDGQTILPDLTAPSLISPDKITIIPIDLGNTSVTQSPSSQAWNLARTVAFTGGISTDDSRGSDINEDNPQILVQQETSALFNKIIDVWATFTTPDENVTEIPSTTDNQSAQEELNNYLDNFKKRLGQK